MHFAIVYLTWEISRTDLILADYTFVSYAGCVGAWGWGDGVTYGADLLTPWFAFLVLQYHILRQKGTEPAGTGEYNKHKEDGVYNCAGCGTPLYT